MSENILTKLYITGNVPKYTDGQVHLRRRAASVLGFGRGKISVSPVAFTTGWHDAQERVTDKMRRGNLIRGGAEGVKFPSETMGDLRRQRALLDSMAALAVAMEVECPAELEPLNITLPGPDQQNEL